MLRFYKKSIYKFYKCLNTRFTPMTDSQKSWATVALVWCWKQVKDIILEFSISGSFFSEKTTFWLLVSFPLGWCVDEIVDGQANYQGSKYDANFLECHTFAVIHSVNGQGVC